MSYARWLASSSFASGIAACLGAYFLAIGQWWWAVGYSVSIILLFAIVRECHQRLRSDEIAAKLGGPLMAEMSRDPGAVITMRRIEHDDGPHWQATVTHRNREDDLR